MYLIKSNCVLLSIKSKRQLQKFSILLCLEVPAVVLLNVRIWASFKEEQRTWPQTPSTPAAACADWGLCFAPCFHTLLWFRCRKKYFVWSEFVGFGSPKALLILHVENWTQAQIKHDAEGVHMQHMVSDSSDAKWVFHALETRMGWYLPDEGKKVVFQLFLKKWLKQKLLTKNKINYFLIKSFFHWRPFMIPYIYIQLIVVMWYLAVLLVFCGLARTESLTFMWLTYRLCLSDQSFCRILQR